MVLFLNGSLGVGKTSVARYLLWSHPKTVLLEGDALCNLNPFDAYDQRRIEALTDIVCYMIRKYRSIGYDRFVVDTIFEKASEVQAVNGALGEVDSDISHYLLHGGDGKREANIRKRNRENFLWEIERSRQLQGILMAEFRTDDRIRKIDVTEMEVSQVGERILRDRGKV